MKRLGAEKGLVLKKQLRNLLVPTVVLLLYGLLNGGFPCLIRRSFGIPCPGCGLTRAFFELGHGHWRESFAWHPLWPIIVVMVLVYLLQIQPFFEMPRAVVGFLENKRVKLVFGLIAVFLFLGLYIRRMMLYFPDNPPMNYDAQALLPRILRALFSKA